jgi:hypothetical protein
MTWDESITRREAHLRPARTQVGGEGTHSKINKKRERGKKKCFILFFE